MAVVTSLVAAYLWEYHVRPIFVQAQRAEQTAPNANGDHRDAAPSPALSNVEAGASTNAGTEVAEQSPVENDGSEAYAMQPTAPPQPVPYAQLPYIQKRPRTFYQPKLVPRFYVRPGIPSYLRQQNGAQRSAGRRR